jgi:hypothetical protein
MANPTKVAIKGLFRSFGLAVRRTAAVAPDDVLTRVALRGFPYHCKSLGFKPGSIFEVGVPDPWC